MGGHLSEKAEPLAYLGGWQVALLEEVGSLAVCPVPYMLPFSISTQSRSAHARAKWVLPVCVPSRERAVVRLNNRLPLSRVVPDDG
jgi:hypothetical protein